MRILHLVSDAFGGHGGIAKYNRDLIRALCSLPNVEQLVCLPRVASESIGPLPAKLHLATNALGGKVRFVRATVGELVRGSADIVICGHINLLPLAYLASSRCRAPLALFIYGIDAWTRTNYTSRFLVQRTDSIVSISETTRDLFCSWTGIPRERCTLLPNAFDPNDFGPGPASDALLQKYGLKNKFVLMTLGRMAAEERCKGFDEVLNLLPTLAKEIPNVTYLLVGDGADRPRLEQKVRTLGVENHVVFAGKIPEASKLDHYRAADVFVMPSRGEGFGFVFLEAMACGIPVVASRADGSREAVRNGLLGELVDPKSPEDIRRGILAAAARPRRVVPEGLEFFSFENFQLRVGDWLNGLIGDRPRPHREPTQESRLNSLSIP